MKKGERATNTSSHSHSKRRTGPSNKGEGVGPFCLTVFCHGYAGVHYRKRKEAALWLRMQPPLLTNPLLCNGMSKRDDAADHLIN